MDVPAAESSRRTAVCVTAALVARFTPKVLHGVPSDCWPWIGAMRNGYGAIKHNKKVLSAHVVAWVIANGTDVPDGKIICHTCDNRRCCNPDHLYAGSYADNVRDADERLGEYRPRGIGCHNAVMTDDTVRLVLAIRSVLGWGGRRISKVLSLNEWTIRSVIRRKSWEHVSAPSIDEAKQIVIAWKDAR